MIIRYSRVIKNLCQFDETWVLIAGIANLIFSCCYEVHFSVNWLLKFDPPPQLVIWSIKTLPEQIIGLNIDVYLRQLSNKHCFTLKLVFSAFEIRSFFSLFHKKESSHMQGFTVQTRNSI